MPDRTTPREETPRRRRRSAGRRPPEPKADRLARGRSARLRRLREALRAQLRLQELERERPSEPDSDTPDVEQAEEGGAPAPVEDDLPEHVLYRDTGCHKWHSCLSCPLPRCIYDQPVELARETRRRRDRAIHALYRRGWSTGRIAQRFGISPAQVRRIRGPREREPS